MLYKESRDYDAAWRETRSSVETKPYAIRGAVVKNQFSHHHQRSAASLPYANINFVEAIFII
jgi:hypothetical protein